MLLIKKIETQSDIDELLQIDSFAEERIYMLSQQAGKAEFVPMNKLHESELKKFFGLFKDRNATVWQGGYYVAEQTFELTFDGMLSAEDTPRKLLTTLGIKVNGFDFNGDMSEVVNAMGGKKEFFREDLEPLLKARQKVFFDRLQRLLYQSAGQADIKEQIFELARYAVSGCFPYLKVELTSSAAEEELTEEEKLFKENSNILAEAQIQYDHEVKMRQAESSRKLSLLDIENNEHEAEHALAVRAKERQIERQAKDAYFKQCLYDAEKARTQSLVELQELATKEAELKLQQEQIEAKRKNIDEYYKVKAQLNNTMLAEQLAQKDTAEINREKAREELEITKICKEKAQEELELIKIEKQKKELELKKLTDAALERPADPQHDAKVKNLDEQQTDIIYKSSRSSIIDLVDRHSRNRSVKLAKSNTRKAVCNVTARGLKLAPPIEVIAPGTQFRISFKSSVSGYLTLLCLDAAGSRTLLAPNCIDPGNHTWIIADREYTVPSADAPPLQTDLVFTQDGTLGKERILAIVTPKPLFDIDFENVEDLVSFEQAQLDGACEFLQDLDEKSWSAGVYAYIVEEANKQ